MIKINIMSEKDNGKTLTSYLLGVSLCKKNSTAIINFDSLSKSKDFFKKMTLNKKLLLNDKHVKVYKIKNNLDYIDLSPVENVFNNIDQILLKITNDYKIIILDSLSSFNIANFDLISKSDYIICPFKIEKDLVAFKDKIINTFIDNNLSTNNLKFLAFLTNDNYFNMTKIITLRKELSSLLFKTTIPFVVCKTYSDILKNTTLLNSFESLVDELKLKLDFS